MLRGFGVRVQTVLVAAREWSPERIGDEYGLTPSQVEQALAFYEAHRLEIDAAVEAEKKLDMAHEEEE